MINDAKKRNVRESVFMVRHLRFQLTGSGSTFASSKIDGCICAIGSRFAIPSFCLESPWKAQQKPFIENLLSIPAQ